MNNARRPADQPLHGFRFALETAHPAADLRNWPHDLSSDTASPASGNRVNKMPADLANRRASTQGVLASSDPAELRQLTKDCKHDLATEVFELVDKDRKGVANKQKLYDALVHGEVSGRPSPDPQPTLNPKHATLLSLGT